MTVSMSSDGPTPAPCDPDIFARGELVFQTDTIPSNAMEKWVKQIAEQSGQQVDWHFAGGRARVLALGDVKKVKQTIVDLLPEHDLLYKKEMEKLHLSWERPYYHLRAALNNDVEIILVAPHEEERFVFVSKERYLTYRQADMARVVYLLARSKFDSMVPGMSLGDRRMVLSFLEEKIKDLEIEFV